MNNRLIYMFRWFKQRLKRTAERDQVNSILLLIVFWLFSSAVAVVIAIGNPTGASVWSRVSDMVKAVGINSLGFAVLTVVMAALLSLMYIPLPRLVSASFLYVGTLTVVTLHLDENGVLFSYLIGIGYSVIALFIGILIIGLIRIKQLRMLFYTVAVAGIVVEGVFLVINHEESEQAVQSVNPDLPENPGETGAYEVDFLAYGSGEDLHRDAFGHSVDEVVPEVDASDRVTKWPESREDFWGFGPKNLPLNGRVWMPKGEGPFPVILMAHGNHTMEYFSTGGYDYLGKQLASRGFTFISVDEDFVNYSNVSGSPNDNYELRAWLLLQHLLQLKDMNQSEDSLLSGKLDMQRVGLAGHSRGGQAAPMAADYERFFDDESIREGMKDIQIEGVAALAPTDKTIDGEKPELHNISYLLLQGAQDADISDFRGDQQYYRSTMDAYSNHFKTSLFIANANHVYFNSDWGNRDLSLPRGLFLGLDSLMDASEQRQIAKVYFSAFFERVFTGDRSFDDLFKHNRYGSDWLPDTDMMNKYRDGTYEAVMQFYEGEEIADHLKDFTKAEIVTPEDRMGNNQPVDALQLEWEDKAVYEVDLSRNDLQNAASNDAQSIVLTMANLDEEAVPNIEIELESVNGESVKKSMEEFMTLPPVIQTDFTPYGMLDGLFRDGKYETSWAPIFQTIEIPLEDFETSGEKLGGDTLKLSLHFNSGQGKVMLGEIGVS